LTGALTQIRKGGLYGNDKGEKIDIKMLLPGRKRSVVSDATNRVECSSVEDEAINVTISLHCSGYGRIKRLLISAERRLRTEKD